MVAFHRMLDPAGMTAEEAQQQGGRGTVAESIRTARWPVPARTCDVVARQVVDFSGEVRVRESGRKAGIAPAVGERHAPSIVVKVC
jgi:hypothetical protein